MVSDRSSLRRLTITAPPTTERAKSGNDKDWKSTRHLIERAIGRFIRAGGRQTEGDAAHLLEGIAVVVFDVDTGVVDPKLPAVESGLRWPEFIDLMAWRYRRGPSAGAMSSTDAWLLGAGIGALAIVGWEIAEWIVAETGAGGNLSLTYGDTVGDLTLSTAGGMVGSWLGVCFLGDRSQLSGRARLS